MTSFKTFALVGVGTLGSLVAEELLLRNVHVKILTRDATQVSSVRLPKRIRCLTSSLFSSNCRRSGAEAWSL